MPSDAVSRCEIRIRTLAPFLLKEDSCGASRANIEAQRAAKGESCAASPRSSHWV